MKTMMKAGLDAKLKAAAVKIQGVTRAACVLAFAVSALAGGAAAAAAAAAGATPPTAARALAAAVPEARAASATFTVVTPLSGIGSYEPQGRLVTGADGLLYGTFNSTTTSPLGAVYRVERDGTLTIVHAFSDYTDGAQPEAMLLPAADGWLYGTSGGGAHGDGTIFRVAPDGRFEKLHDFDRNDGDTAFPWGPVARGEDGTLYGTTWGTRAFGNVYALHADGRFEVLHAFAYADGSAPNGLVTGPDGRFYGTTFSGGANQWGVLYAVSSTGAFELLHSFYCGNDGCNSQGSLLAGHDGWLYGTTANGGYRADGLQALGTVFRWRAGSGFHVVHAFAMGAPEGARPGLELDQDEAGRVYGATQLGASGHGTVFRLHGHGRVEVLHVFSGGLDGGSPWTGPTVSPVDRSLFGVTLQGGADGLGTLYSMRRVP